MEFNADNGIYRMTVDRDTEIKESKIFEDLYNRLRPILAKTIIIVIKQKSFQMRVLAMVSNLIV